MKTGALSLAVVLACSTTSWAATTVTTIQSFCDSTVATPLAGLVRGPSGALFGESMNPQGGLFKLTPPTGPATTWPLSVPYVFSNRYYALSSPVIDGTGALIGVLGATGVGAPDVAYKLDPPAPGKTNWSYSVLHSFNADTDGAQPKDALVIANGALYGTTLTGGPRGAGTVFRLSPPGPGQTTWQYSVLHAFASNESGNPYGALLPRIVGGNLTLFGTTSSNFSSGFGSVFRLTAPPTLSGAWSFETLYAFASTTSGAGPRYALTADRSLNLYGVTFGGGSLGYGVAYRVSPPAVGQTKWTGTVLHEFRAKDDGSYPSGPLFEDERSNLYGTAGGGALVGGILYKLTPVDFGGKTLPWNKVNVVNFPIPIDGQRTVLGTAPSGTLLQTTTSGPTTGLFGTTGAGGTCNSGTAYRVDF